MNLTGKAVFLRPLTIADKETFYQWATHSDATPFWYGELYGDEVPDRSSFFEDWTDEYFNDESIEKRSYAIVVTENDEEIGQINYQLDKGVDTSYIEIDIIIASDNHKNKGYGSESIALLIDYLKKLFPALPIYIYALAENQRAIKAYKKAGFLEKRRFVGHHSKEWLLLTIETPESDKSS